MTRPLSISMLLLAAVLTVAGCGNDDHAKRGSSSHARPSSTSAAKSNERPAKPPKPVATQDRFSPARRREDERVMRARPLLRVLPLRISDAILGVDGLAKDGVRVKLKLHAPGRSKADAMRLYSDLLDAYGDRASNYEIEVDR